jgi:hypothetical protein
MSDCKKGQHQYSGAQYIGAGIARQVCNKCGAVSIDLTSVDDSIDTPLIHSHRSLSSTNGDASWLPGQDES